MSATLYPRGISIGVAHTPYRFRRKSHSKVIPIQETNLQRPDKAIRLGHHIDPMTGRQLLGQAYLPLSTLQGHNEAFNVFGETGAGKSIGIRRIVEYFAISEGRCVIIIDPTKNQYWSMAFEQDRQSMIDALASCGEKPQSIPEVVSYVPIYDEPVIGMDNIRRDFHAEKLLSLKTSGLTAQGFFELGDIDPSGRMYQNYLEEILNIPKNKRTVAYISDRLADMMNDKTKTRSVSSLVNLFTPLCNLGIIRDDGTDISEMLHPPRKNRPGRVSIINLGTSSVNDRRKNAIVSSLCQQLFDYVRDDRTIHPVLVLDESKEFVGKKSSEATISSFSRIHLQCRAWGVTRIFGFQNQDDVQSWLFGGNTPINIQMKKSLSLSDGCQVPISDSGLAHVFIQGSGDPKIPDMDFLCKFLPCTTKHVD